MTKQLIFFLSAFLFTSVRSEVDSLYILQNRLKQINNFYVHFIQKINTSDKNQMEISQGELWIKQPNLFHWHTFNPEESFLISDGTVLWFYMPILKQVTVYWLQNSIADNIVLKLLFSNDISQWNNYNVVQKKDWFYLKPDLHNYTDLKECKIKITDSGVIDRFIITEESGQYIDYYLFDQKIKPVDINKFNFIISTEMQVDDQRK